jgi:hypothetical protein
MQSGYNRPAARMKSDCKRGVRHVDCFILGACIVVARLGSKQMYYMDEKRLQIGV